MKKILFSLLTLGVLVIVGSVSAGPTTYFDLKGKIVLRVEKNGEAYYVNPQKFREAIYLGRPEDAFSLLRAEGVGITNANLERIPFGFPETFSGTDTDGDDLPDNLEIALGTMVLAGDTDGDGYGDYAEVYSGYNPNGPGKMKYDMEFAQAQAGKIFLQVERNGEAWYIDTKDYKRHYLGTPEAAFDVMRSLGLGINEYNFGKNLNVSQVSIPEGDIPVGDGQVVLDRVWNHYKDITTYKATGYPVEHPPKGLPGEAGITIDDIVEIADVDISQTKASAQPFNIYFHSPDKIGYESEGGSSVSEFLSLIPFLSLLREEKQTITIKEETTYRGVPVVIIEFIDKSSEDSLTRLWITKDTYKILRVSAYGNVEVSETLKDLGTNSDPEEPEIEWKIIEGRYAESVRSEFDYAEGDLLPRIAVFSYGLFFGFISTQTASVIDNYEYGVEVPGEAFKLSLAYGRAEPGYRFSHPSNWEYEEYSELYGMTSEDSDAGSGHRLKQTGEDYILTIVHKPNSTADWLINYRKSNNSTITPITFNELSGIKSVTNNGDCTTTHIAVDGVETADGFDLVTGAFEVFYNECDSHEIGVNATLRAIVASIIFN